MQRMPTLPTAIFFIIATGISAPAFAQETDLARFALEKTETGFVRLDRKTGALTLCQEKDGALTCRMAADERAAYEEDLTRLEKRVEALESSLASGRPLAKGEPLPSDEEVERSIGIMERFMRSFFGLVEEFKAKEDGATPDKT
ncbi:unnamed protein product [Ciceribacter selenitireducens ATCC BAA-1503]|uniref:Uncharacterized protein n=2 Tax=Ciceribacter selenitireducens TaxID=448181 RepID=A0A376ACC8_9HYPH|nr:unnamed protein product [Ciceribacter selenitireducens ATCC BAA-1503]